MERNNNAGGKTPKEYRSLDEKMEKVTALCQELGLEVLICAREGGTDKGCIRTVVGNAHKEENAFIANSELFYETIVQMINVDPGYLEVVSAAVDEIMKGAALELMRRDYEKSLKDDE